MTFYFLFFVFCFLCVHYNFFEVLACLNTWVLLCKYFGTSYGCCMSCEPTTHVWLSSFFWAHVGMNFDWICVLNHAIEMLSQLLNLDRKFVSRVCCGSHLFILVFSRWGFWEKQWVKHKRSLHLFHELAHLHYRFWMHKANHLYSTLAIYGCAKCRGCIPLNQGLGSQIQTLKLNYDTY